MLTSRFITTVGGFVLVNTSALDPLIVKPSDSLKFVAKSFPRELSDYFPAKKFTSFVSDSSMYTKNEG